MFFVRLFVCLLFVLFCSFIYLFTFLSQVFSIVLREVLRRHETDCMMSGAEPVDKPSTSTEFIIIIINNSIIIISSSSSSDPLAARIVWAPQMILQPVCSIFLCSPQPSGTWRSRGRSIPWCCLPTSSAVCSVFFSLSQCLARWFWPDLMNGKHDHTTKFASLYDRQTVFVWSNCLLDLSMDFLVGNMVFVRDV